MAEEWRWVFVSSPFDKRSVTTYAWILKVQFLWVLYVNELQIYIYIKVFKNLIIFCDRVLPPPPSHLGWSWTFITTKWLYANVGMSVYNQSSTYWSNVCLFYWFLIWYKNAFIACLRLTCIYRSINMTLLYRTFPHLRKICFSTSKKIRSETAYWKLQITNSNN